MDGLFTTLTILIIFYERRRPWNEKKWIKLNTFWKTPGKSS